MRALVVLVVAGCWANDARTTTPTAQPIVRYDFRGVAMGAPTTWRATVVGENFTIVYDGKTVHGVLAHGPRALDFRGSDGSVILGCRRVPVDVHPVGAELTVACNDDTQDATPAWSAPAEPLDAWSCLTHGDIGPMQEVIFVEDVPIEVLSHECCVADNCTYGYDGYRRRR